MTKEAMTAQNQLNLSVVALVALVAMVGLVALVLNSPAVVPLEKFEPSVETAGTVYAEGGSENVVGEVGARKARMKPVRR